MAEYPPSLERLLHELAKLPGIGPRTAQRLALHLLKQPLETSRALSTALVEARTKLHPCKDCFNLTEEVLCHICRMGSRDRTSLLVVEDPSDVVAFERTHEYHGLFHVLGGTLSPLEGRGPQDLTLDSLVERVKKSATFKEVIVATDPTVEGDSTALYIQQLLKGVPVRVTRLARGMPSGGDVEYADETTLLKALEGRREI
ncbi:MAG TPA: recombination mediator RecR [bacterium]|nr:recombination mediator RecR [bacterium]